MTAFATEMAFVGLGNPGAKYAGTRHNAGFMLADVLAQAEGGTFSSKFHGQYCKMTLGDHTIHLLKPDTFMNLSGKAVQALLAFYKIPPAQLIVAHDELDIATGSVKVKQGGGHGGHNGLRDIDRAIGTSYHRLRIGIDHPRELGLRIPVERYVLQPFSADEQQIISSACDNILRTLPLWLTEGKDAFLNQLALLR